MWWSSPSESEAGSLSGTVRSWPKIKRDKIKTRTFDTDATSFFGPRVGNSRIARLLRKGAGAHIQMSMGNRHRRETFFFFFWLRWVFIAAHRLSLVAVSRGHSSLRCAGLSLQWLLPLRSTGSRHAGLSSCGSRALECRLSRCVTQAQLLRGTWDPPGPGLEPVSPALAGGLSTTAPPGNPRHETFVR